MKRRGNPVRCIETQKVYASYAAADEACHKTCPHCKRTPTKTKKIGSSAIFLAVRGATKTAYGYHWEALTKEQFNAIVLAEEILAITDNKNILTFKGE